MGQEMSEVNDFTRSSLFEAILARTWTSETLPEIRTQEQRTIYQRAADAMERYAFARDEAFDPEKWRTWLSTPGGRLCTAIGERIL